MLLTEPLEINPLISVELKYVCAHVCVCVCACVKASGVNRSPLDSVNYGPLVT